MKHSHKLLLAFSLLSFAAWPDLSFKDAGKNIISSTTGVSGSQIDAVVKAGEKISEASGTLTQEQEYYLGRSVSALILQQYPLYREEDLTHYVNLVGSVLAARSSKPEIFSGYHFAILDTKEINALSAPGGFIYVSRGFLDIIPDEEALAGVLAHEIGHVVLGHGVKAISQAKLGEAAVILGKEAASSYGPSEVAALTNTFSSSVDDIFNTLIKSGYSRSQEYEADAFAAKLMAKTGYSVKGLTSMLDQLAKASAQSRGGWMDTHPGPDKRKASLALPKQSLDPAMVEKRTARLKTAEGRS